MRLIHAVAGFLLVLAAGLLAQEKYRGPRPAKPDVPYLLHASSLVETETLDAKEEAVKDFNVATIPGAASPVRTPLAEPIFLFQSEKVPAEKLQMYQLTVKNGRREVAFPSSAKKVKDAPRPVHLTFKKLEPGLWRIEAAQILDNGEYCLSPAGASAVFCFQIY
jgi:hypothetical protein